jgi:hypothetical protein
VTRILINLCYMRLRRAGRIRFVSYDNVTPDGEIISSRPLFERRIFSRDLKIITAQPVSCRALAAPKMPKTFSRVEIKAPITRREQDERVVPPRRGSA